MFAELTPTLLVIAMLATWQAVEVWHHGLVFASRRALCEERQGFFDRLLLCPFCLSVWVGCFVVPFLTVRPQTWLILFTNYPVWNAIVAVAISLAFLVQTVIAGLAASRLANLANDLFWDIARTPNKSEEEDPEEVG